eukprot:CAMPEP_0181518646 /NCGR_PEP_ID=MMETSP1110-20121109/65370_1 /TAXON_ID=174948 /ORGANISM="Symbiodinium sp., Strain CCMP421" /LENGTH=50 /DNA_ID=CAMNT_0023649047 /DNA_START=838 /DNA_END=990 /DNA_ORIENTATION=-
MLRAALLAASSFDLAIVACRAFSRSYSSRLASSSAALLFCVRHQAPPASS